LQSAKTAQGEGTFKIFGAQDEKGYLDKYSIKESIEDETTLPIKHVMDAGEGGGADERLERVVYGRFLDPEARKAFFEILRAFGKYYHRHLSFAITSQRSSDWPNFMPQFETHTDPRERRDCAPRHPCYTRNDTDEPSHIALRDGSGGSATGPLLKCPKIGQHA
jgi:hypothetical protein